jgi:hypothetical protein
MTTMTDDSIALRELLEESTDADLLREMIGLAAERLMALEVQALTRRRLWRGSPSRLAQRDDYRDRDWETRAGTVELRIPSSGRQLLSGLPGAAAGGHRYQATGNVLLTTFLEDAPKKSGNQLKNRLTRKGRKRPADRLAEPIPCHLSPLPGCTVGHSETDMSDKSATVCAPDVAGATKFMSTQGLRLWHMG